MSGLKLHPNFLQLGTVVTVPMKKWLGIPRHFGLITGNMGFDGFTTVIANAPDAGGPAEVTWSKFTDGLLYEHAFYPSDLLPYQVLHNTLLYWNTPYDLADWNCEHFAYACHGLPPRSRQVEIAAAVSIVGGLAIAATLMARKGN
jgi:hypothetical protein